jgi:molybdenum cofactor synthesis domain-containing protein
MGIRVAVVTVSDRCAAGEQEDASGALVKDWIRDAGHELAAAETVPDDMDRVTMALARLADDGAADVIITTGGTGLAPRDLTPEATRAVLERDAPGIAEAIRMDGRSTTKRAALSRGLAGVRAASLIVNLPGSPSGVRDGLATLAELLPHAVRILRDEDTDH